MLAHETFGRGAAAFLFLHGILGRGRNWRSIARRFAEARSDWRAVTVDLRAHGDSLGLEGPHGVDTAAADLSSLSLDVPVRAVLGHSFGGKVALQFATTHSLDALWIIDSSPSARPDRHGSEAIAEVLSALNPLPERFEDRREFVAIMQSRGLSLPVARWLAMNLREHDGGFRYGVEMSAVEDLLADYFERDAWSGLLHADTRKVAHFVLGGRSQVFDAGDRVRAEDAGLTLHTFEGAGHWVHAEEPDRLIELLVAETPPPAVQPVEGEGPRSPLPDSAY